MESTGIYVGPTAAEELVEAVTGAGGRVVAAEDAAAVVWYGGPPDRFRDIAHAGIRWVQLPSAGIEPWLDAGLVTRDRVFTSAVGAYAPAVAEHTVALLLAGLRRLPGYARARTWTEPEAATLRGATVAVVGAGGIGSEVIRLLQPFGAQVLAVTRSGRDVSGAAESLAADALHDVLGRSDHVVLAAPATDETRALIGADELAAMRPGGWLVNIARGSLVDTDALLAALRSGHLGGAALDVTDPEPLPDGHPLWDEPRVLITPHSANPANLSVPQLAERVRRNAEAFLAGREDDLEGRVDLDAGY